MRRVLILLFVALPLFAQDSNVLNFGKGPYKWLMTREEERAWRNVKTEEQAKDFIDLFWARRDPTRGTPVNQTRLEIESRVRYADINFKEGNIRGSLTERGRVLITLGFPKSLQSEAEMKTSQSTGGEASGRGSNDPTGGRELAARETWEYEHDAAVKYGVPKILVVYIFDGKDGRARRDPQRTDFTSALPGAIAYYIKNPDLTSVPDWARAIQYRPAAPIAMTEAVVPASEIRLSEKGSGTTTVMTQSALPAVTAKPAGAGRLTLMKDAFSINAQGGGDPFAAMTSESKFTKDDELGWAVEYCTGSAATDIETVNVSLKISGVVKGEKVNFNAPAEDLSPDSIKGSPGCYVVRGAVPLSEMDPGNYTVVVSIAGQAGQQSYNLTREFQVE